MKKRQLKKRSKRRSLADKYRVQKKVKEHHRKVKKEARKAKKLGLPVKNMSKITKIPNLFPGKMEMLEEQDLLKEIEKNKDKHSMIKPEDVEALVAEETGKEVMKEEEGVKETSRYDAKRELNTLISKADIVIEIVDARDPLNYRSKELENNVVKKKDKKLIIVINKVDLVSKENAETWGKYIRRDYPTVLLSTKSSSIDQPLENLLSLIKSLELPNKRLHIAVVGYHNTGKSSFIKCFTHKYKSLCKSHLIPGVNEVIIETNLRLYTTPGVILSKNEMGPLMPKSAKSVDNLKNPIDLAKRLLDFMPHDDLLELYEIPDFDNHVEFLENVAKNKNLKIKGGLPDVERAARYIINDIIEGKIKYETPYE